MLDIHRDIDSLSSFKRDSRKFLRRLKRTGQPVVLTRNGKAAVVVQDAAAYQRLLDLAERAEAVVGIRKGLASMERGEGIPADEAFEGLRRKYKIPRHA